MAKGTSQMSSSYGSSDGKIILNFVGGLLNVTTSVLISMKGRGRSDYREDSVKIEQK